MATSGKRTPTTVYRRRRVSGNLAWLLPVPQIVHLAWEAGIPAQANPYARKDESHPLSPTRLDSTWHTPYTKATGNYLDA